MSHVYARSQQASTMKAPSNVSLQLPSWVAWQFHFCPFVSTAPTGLRSIAKFKTSPERSCSFYSLSSSVALY